MSYFSIQKRKFILSGLGFLSGLTAPELLYASLADPKKRLILIELAGANDSLNMLVPFRDDQYYALRPNISLAAKSLIQLDDQFSFNQSLISAMPIWERGELAVVHGLSVSEGGAVCLPAQAALGYR